MMTRSYIYSETIIIYIKKMLKNPPTDKCVEEWPFKYINGRPTIASKPATWEILKQSGKFPDYFNKYALHSCDNRKCLNIRHLRWGTPADNTKDYRERINPQDGSLNVMAKLDEKCIKTIRNVFWRGTRTLDQLAEDYDVSKASISRIVNCKTWKHVSCPRKNCTYHIKQDN